MKLITVVPITNTPIPETLSYYGKQDIDPGSVIDIPVGKKTMLALVIKSEPLHNAKATLKKAEFAMKKLGETPCRIKLDSTPLLEMLSDFYVAPKHHVLHTLFPAALQELLKQDGSIPKVTNLHICPSWRHTEYLQQHMDAAVVLHTNLTKKKQADILASDIETLITTPSLAHIFVNTDVSITLHFPESEHWYRHRAPFYDHKHFITKLAEHKKVSITEAPTPNPKGVVYHTLKKQKFPYTLVIHPDILIHIKKLIEQGEKVLVVAPRKGFAAGAVCRDCGKTALDEVTGKRFKVVEKEGAFVYETDKTTTAARHTCQFCNGTRLDMFGFGTKALEKVLKRNFSNFPITTIDQTSGKKLLQAADDQEGGIVLGTNIAPLHLTSTPYHAVYLGLGFQLGIPSYSQVSHCIHQLGFLSENSKSVWVPVEDKENHLVEQFATESYGDLLKEEDELKKQFSMPPHGCLIEVQGAVYQSAVDQITEKISQLDGVMLKQRPYGQKSILVTAEYSNQEHDAVIKVLGQLIKILPKSQMRINPRNT